MNRLWLWLGRKKTCSTCYWSDPVGGFDAIMCENHDTNVGWESKPKEFGCNCWEAK